VELDKGETGYPRVLVVDAVSFHRRMNVGILKSNLFHGWPSNSLAQVIIGDDRPDFTICSKYWRITRRDRSRAACGKCVPQEPTEEPLRSAGGKGHVNNLRSRKWADQLRAAFGYIPWVTPITISRDFRKWLTECRPEVIFTLGASLGVLSTVRRLSDDLGIPVVPDFTDDWIEWLYKRGPLDSFLHSRLAEAVSDCLKRSPVRLTVSQAMAQEYSRRYGGEFIPCMDCVNLDGVDYKAYEVRRRPVKFLFMGYLEPERSRSLKLLGDSIETLRAQGLDASLDIYTFPDQIARYGSRLHSPPAVKVCGTVPPEKVSALLSDADVLVHAEAFGLQYGAEIGLSLSTKISQYMAAGRAILGVGPGATASMQYLEQSGGGIVAGEENCLALQAVVRRLVCDADFRANLAQKARETAERNHDAVKTRTQFKTILSEVAQMGIREGQVSR
jgi:glycosyltransferase involved in cell wall biosynthesis